MSAKLYRKLTCVALSLVAFGVPVSDRMVFAKRQPASYGTLKIRTNPSGFPLQLDGKSYGLTTTDDRSFDLEPGVHNILITLPGGQVWSRDLNVERGRIKCIALNYREAPTLNKSLCPFPVNLSAPTQVNEGELITYTADVKYQGTTPLNYAWTVSPASARILNGAGTRTITVDSTGMAGQRLVVTLAVDDGSGQQLCHQTVRASTFVTSLPRRENPAREFDVCAACSYDDQKARLDNLAVELQRDPSLSAYIISYGGRVSRVGTADRLGARAKEYLVSKRGIDQSRITLLNGGFREDETLQLWIIPRGATPPQPSPTLQPGDAMPPRENPSGRRPRN
jgi:hypothetical protein